MSFFSSPSSSSSSSSLSESSLMNRVIIDSIRNGTHPLYQLVIENGQRIIRPINDDFRINPYYDDVRKHEIYLSNLPQNSYEDELLPFLMQAGPLYQLRIIMTLSGATKGKAYAIFADIESSLRAVQILNGQCIRSSYSLPVKVEFSVNNNRLRVRGIPNSIKSSEQLQQRLCLIGIEDIRLFPAKNLDTIIVNGSSVDDCGQEAIIVFHEHSQAASTRRVFISGSIEIDGHKLTANWDIPDKSILQ